MATRTFKTNLRCAGCLDAIRPHLDTTPGVSSWSVDLDRPDKPLTVEGEAVSPATVEAALGRAGYRVLGEVATTPVATTDPAFAPVVPLDKPPSYYPLIVILAYLVGVTAAVEVVAGTFEPMRAMRHFMAGFFLVFSFFKLLDLAGFAESFAMYDVVAGAFPPYGTVYPFIELTLGFLYLLDVAPFATNVATLVVMGVGTVGVVRSIVSRRKVRCACLGTVINLPVATVTLLEDAGMAAMAAAMLVLMR
jgi:copper chaperone CopZ